MALSKIRRFLIATVGFLLLVDLVLLGLVWSGVLATEEPEGRKNVVVWVEDPDAAEGFAAGQRSAGREVSLAEGDRTIQVPDGFRLVVRNSATARSIFEALKIRKQPVKLSEDANEVQYGGIFSDRAKAEAEVQRILKTEQMQFTVVENLRDKSVKAHRLVVRDLDPTSTGEVTEFFKGKGLEFEILPAASGNPEESE